MTEVGGGAAAAGEVERVVLDPQLGQLGVQLAREVALRVEAAPVGGGEDTVDPGAPGNPVAGPLAPVGIVADVGDHLEVRPEDGDPALELRDRDLVADHA